MTNMENILPVIERAASASDRWWVAALFALLIGFIVLAGRWLVRKHEALIDQQRADQSAYGTNLLNIASENAKTSKELGGIIARNTDALQHCADVFNNHAHRP